MMCIANFDPTPPMPHGDDDLKRIAQHQADWHREHHPGKAIGARLLCAEITRSGMTITELREIEDRPSA